jgi:chromosome partitioning protein
MKARVISVVNQKGGVGKTTTAVNLATIFAVMDKKVLIIDIDSQGNTSSGLGIKQTERKITSYNVFIGLNSIRDAILATEVPNLSIVSANTNLAAIELDLIHLKNYKNILLEKLEEIKNDFDYIIIDCAPSLGLLTLNALTAADSVVIPIQCEYFALEGLGKLLNTIKSVQKIHNPSLDIEGLLLTMYDTRLRLSNQVVEEVQKHFNNMVFSTIIQRNIKLSEAPSFGESIINYDATSKGAANYLNLAEEIIKKNSSN